MHERADLGLLVVRVADDDALGALGVALAELVVDRALDQDAAAGRAALAVQREDAEQRRVDRGVEVGVGEHDGGRLAAELHREALEERRRVAEDQLPRAALARERDQGNIGMLDEGVARLLAEPVDEVEHPLRQPGVLEDPRPEARRQRRELGRLEHDRAAGGERGRQLPALEHERRVPRGDEPGDADRLAVDVVHLLAGHLVGVVGLGDDQVGEEPEVLGGALRLSERLRDRQAGVEGLPLGELAVARFDGVGDPVQDARAVAGQHPGPRPLA